MKKISTFVFIVGFSVLSYAQHYGIVSKSQWTSYKKATALIKKHSYYNAIDLLYDLTDSLPDNDRVNYTLGKTYLATRDYKNAELWLKKVAETQTKEAEYPRSVYEYAQALHMQGKYHVAKTQYFRFLRIKARNKNIKTLQKVTRTHISSCNWAIIELQEDPQYVKIDLLKGDVNHSYTDFSPMALADDHLIFASLRADTILSVGADFQPKYNVNLYETYKEGGVWEEPSKLIYANLPYQNTANGAYNPDSSRFYFTQCFFNRDHQIQCHIHYAERVAEGKYEGNHKVHSHINSTPSTSTQPTFQKYVKGRGRKKKEITVMYFVSNRVGGVGGMDIWYTTVNEKGKFSAPVNCKRINTALDEVSPYYDTEKGKLYYSSNLRKGFGGFDVFAVKGTQKRWRTVENIGRPYNTSYDDVYFVPSKDSSKLKVEHGFLVSNRPGGHSLKSETCCDDIYSFEEYIPKHVWVEGVVTELHKVPDTNQVVNAITSIDSIAIEPVEIEVADTLNNVKIGYVQKRYANSWEDGDYSGFTDKIVWNDSLNKGGYGFDLIKEKEYLMVVDKGNGSPAELINLDSVIRKSNTDRIVYNMTAPRYVHVDTVAEAVEKIETKEIKVLTLDVTKKELKENKTFLLENMYYDVNKDQLQNRSVPSIELLLSVMEAHPSIRVEIAGHTDSDGTDEYNEDLSQRRAETVRNYLIKHGITATRLVAKGYGESKPTATNKTVAGRQKNRRTEITILN